MSIRILQGDCREVLKTLPAGSVNCCVTSPPYFGLRDYGMTEQIGLEDTPQDFVAALVAVFAEVRRVLRDDGTLWLNLGDSYANDGKWGGSTGGKHVSALHGDSSVGRGKKTTGLKPKDLIGIPWRVAFALQADGWYLRQDIIWHKPNPMPESVQDRCTKAHEYVFLLTKSPSYYCDMDAVRESAKPESDARYKYSFGGPKSEQLTADEADGAGSRTHPIGMREPRRASRDSFKREDSKRAQTIPGQTMGTHRPDRAESEYDVSTRNKRSVWTIATRPYAEAHFATMAPELAETCIRAGCPAGGTVLDPFGGAGTTGLVADQLQRHAVLIELNPAYADLADRRITGDSPLFAEVSV